MRLAVRARPCPACGRGEPPDARWCGDCGAPLEVRDRTLVVHGDRSEEAPAPPSRPARRWGWIVVVVLLAGAAGVLADAGVTGDPTLLGRLDDHSGRSSLLPPVADLQLLWRRHADVGGAPRSGPVPVADLGNGLVAVGSEVIDTVEDRRALDLGGTGARSSARPAGEGGLLLVDGDEVVQVDQRSGRVVRRSEVGPAAGAPTWRPYGAALGWVAGAGVFTDGAGVLGAVSPHGEVLWVGEPSWHWDGAGHDTDWLVVVHSGTPVDRVLVVDGRDGSVHRDVGPAGSIHAPVVHGDTLVYVDPHGGVDRGLGQPVVVQGLLLDGSGRSWAATDLPSTSGQSSAVGLTPVADSVAVHYWTVGYATTAVWFAPGDGAELGRASVGGSGRTEEGWPVTVVVGDGLAHIDPVRDEIRVVDRRGLVRWSIPSVPGEGVVGHGGSVLVRTPPRGPALQARLRLLDTATGDLRWARIEEGAGAARLAGMLDGHVGVQLDDGLALLRDQSWFALDTGRRRAGVGLAATTLEVPLAEAADLALLGRVPVGAVVRPVFALPDRTGIARVVGVDPARLAPTARDLLVGGVREAPAAGGPIGASLADVDRSIVVGPASVTARNATSGAVQWRSATTVALQADLAVLFPEVVAVVGVDGVVHAWSSGDGALRWTLPDIVATAITGAGDVLVVGTITGEVLVVDAAGAVLQRFDAGTGAVGDIAVVDGRVVAIVGREVVAFGRGTAFVEPGDRVEVP